MDVEYYEEVVQIYHTIEDKDRREGDLQLMDIEYYEEVLEVLSEDKKVIQSFVAHVFSIPLSITKVCRVQ